MIGPHFGRSRDYDEFVLGQSPVLWALTAALMYKVPNAGVYIASQLAIVLEKIGGAKPAKSFFTAIWTVHVASAVKNEVTYRAAQDFINERGGIPPDVLFDPLGGVLILDRDDDWEQALAEDREPVPNIPEFRRRLPSYYSRTADVDEGLFEIAYSLLTYNKSLYYLSGWVALSLHTAYGHVPIRSAAD